MSLCFLLPKVLTFSESRLSFVLQVVLVIDQLGKQFRTPPIFWITTAVTKTNHGGRRDTAMVVTQPETQDPVLKSVSKYKKGQNVDYKVVLLPGQ